MLEMCLKVKSLLKHFLLCHCHWIIAALRMMANKLIPNTMAYLSTQNIDTISSTTYCWCFSFILASKCSRIWKKKFDHFWSGSVRSRYPADLKSSLSDIFERSRWQNWFWFGCNFRHLHVWSQAKKKYIFHMSLFRKKIKVNKQF